LTISPSGKEVAYWIDSEQIELRDIDGPNRVARVRVALGTLAWSGDEKRLLVKRGAGAAICGSGDLVWVALPALATIAAGAVPQISEVLPQSILHGLEFPPV